MTKPSVADVSSGRLGVGRQIPRNTLALLMIAQALVMLPHAWQVAPWIIAVGFFCGVWRTLVYQGRWQFPNPWVKASIVVLSMIGIFLSQSGGFTLEGAAAFLVLTYGLKLVEMKSRRDAVIVILLSYFTIATEFVFNQTMAVAVYEFVVLIVVTAAMVGLYQLPMESNPVRSLRVAAGLTMQAVPLMVILFLFFPRIAPLWTVPLPGVAKSGITDRMKPGDIASLIQSDDIAFRVEFAGAIPPPRMLYWRGLVYSRFDGATWIANRRNPPGAALYTESKPYIQYAVLLEPTGEKWLFGLDLASPETPSVSVTRDDTMRAKTAVSAVFRYDVRSYLDHDGALYVSDPLREPFTEADRARETRLPERSNPRIRAFAENLFAEVDSDVDAFVEAIQRHIRTGEYAYTLNPPLAVTPHAVDEFWFGARRGFCAHYASAFAVMMRAVDIPARVVGGYLGGERNSVAEHLVVRQYDAHAWTEVWHEDRGWTRVDPTAAVAPERIENGLTAAVAAADLQALSPFADARLRGFAIAAAIIDFVESIEHRWNLWVVGYDAHVQSRYLQQLLGEMTPARVAMLLMGAGAIAFIVLSVVLLGKRRREFTHPLLKAFSRLESRLVHLGFVRQAHESPITYVRRVGRERGVDSDHYEPVIERCEDLIYNPSATPHRGEFRSLQRALRKFQIQLLIPRVVRS